MPAAFLLLPALVLSQSPEPATSQVLVTVRDIPGDPLAGVRLSLEGNQRGLKAETNELGMVSFGALPAGKYQLKAAKEGFRTQTQEIQLDGTPTRKIELRLVKDASAPKNPATPAA